MALAIDLYCGLGGWTEGLLAEGWDVIGFDIEQHVYGEDRYPGRLVIQDVRTLHGSQFKDADLIVASPPCQEYSYMAMPWTRAKIKAAAIRADRTGAELDRLNRLFNACFRIRREACEAAGRYIPLVVENVRGAQPWIGRARANFGSYYLWGDVPALMPIAAARKNSGGSWFNIGSPGQKVVGQNPDGRLLHRRNGAARTKHPTNPAEHVEEGRKHHGDWFRDPDCPSRQGGQLKPPTRVSARAPAEGRKGVGAGAEWFDQNTSSLPSRSSRRKAASAGIAKIPFTLSSHIARVYKPRDAPFTPSRA